jgi:FkbM family methyltransferase
MMTILKKYLKRILIPDLKYTRYQYPGKLDKLGSSHYGGWTVPSDTLNDHSVCYLGGAGEDISFDVALAQRFGCSVHIFDPTPRARKHFDDLIESVKTGKRLRSTTGEYYDVHIDSLPKLNFEAIGLWSQSETLRFYAPKDQSHVSHSISNLQHTEEFFLAPVKRVSEIMNSKGHNCLDILKLDIEGAEFEVIDSLLEDHVAIRILCVEFHKEDGKLHRIQKYLDKLQSCDYKVVAAENLDFTFINRKHY